MVIAVQLMAAKFGLPVWPHAGGVGLCEYVQHLAMIDYVAITGEKDDKRVEFVDHLHEHFIDPVVMKNGRYMPPKLPGYSIEMKAETLEGYQFPEGPEWLKLSAEGKVPGLELHSAHD